jgi:hypothetical protein
MLPRRELQNSRKSTAKAREANAARKPPGPKCGVTIVRVNPPADSDRSSPSDILALPSIHTRSWRTPPFLKPKAKEP